MTNDQAKEVWLMHDRGIPADEISEFLDLPIREVQDLINDNE